MSGRALLVERHPWRVSELRATKADGSEFVARVLTYNVRDDYATSFRAGIFDTQLDRGDYPPLLFGHDWTSLASVLGAGVDYEPSRVGLDMRFRLDLAANPLAAQASAQLRSGTLKEWSIGFTRMAERQHPEMADTVEITEAFLDEVSIVPRGAVPGTRLLSMRRADHQRLMGLAPEARARALAAHVVGPGQVPAEVAQQVITELGAGLYGLDEGLRRLRGAAVMPELPPALEAEVRSALDAVGRFFPRPSDAAAEAEAAEALGIVRDLDL